MCVFFFFFCFFSASLAAYGDRRTVEEKLSEASRANLKTLMQQRDGLVGLGLLIGLGFRV